MNDTAPRDPALPPEVPDPGEALRDARVTELATGFAIGELDDRELTELYELLRDAQGGAHAARLTWETMRTVTDLRSQVSESFQDTLRHRLGSERSGRFTTRLWNRLGFKVPGLEPVEAPLPSQPLRTVAWIVVSVLGLLIMVGTVVWSRSGGAGTRPVVTGLQGAANVGEQAIAPGAALDNRRLSLKTGSQLTLAWADGSIATLAGPARPAGADDGHAEALVRDHGLELARGRAWLTAHRGFLITLPDRTCEVTAQDTELAVEIIDGRSFVGVRRGTLAAGLGRVAAGSVALTQNGGLGPSGPFTWLWEWDALQGTLSPGHAAPADWRLTADVAWSDPADHAELAFSSATGGRTAVLRCSPGQVEVIVDGRAVQRLPLTGSPMLGFHLDLLQRDGRVLMVTLGERSTEIPLPEPLQRYRLATAGSAAVTVSNFHPLPAPRPPVVGSAE